MKLMIASDLHGSAAYTRRLLELYRDTGCQRLVLLGDLLYHGPRNPLPEGYEPPAVAKLLNDMADELLCVRGNCDAEVDQMVLHFPILSDSALLVLDGLTIHATHGHIHGPDTPPPLRQGDILLCGHFHVPVRRDCGRYTYLNPGSVALPKENSPHSCMVLEDGQFTWLDVVTGQPFQPRGWRCCLTLHKKRTLSRWLRVLFLCLTSGWAFSSPRDPYGAGGANGH